MIQLFHRLQNYLAFYPIWDKLTVTPLRFFHFSHYKIEQEPVIASYNENFNLENRSDIVPIFDNYKTNLTQNKYEFFKMINYTFGKREIDEVIATNTEIKKNRIYRSFILFKKAIRIIIKGK